MELRPFLLDEWLGQKFHADPPIEYDLASSTGPSWTLRELLALGAEDELERLLDTTLFYTPAEGSPELREAIAGMQNVAPEDVLVVTGAAEALLMLFYTVAAPGANIVVPHPGFPANAALPESLGIELRYYGLRAADGFRVDVDEIRRLIDRNTRLALVNSPHNPTGAVVSDVEMDALHDLCLERGVQFVSDEVYHPIYHGAEMRSAARLPHATVLGDFSKALCLSGLRIGWMIERDAERRKRYATARSYFTVSGTAAGERLATLALRHRDAIHGRAKAVAAANLAVLEQLFARYAEILRWVRPEGGMTAFPWLADGGDAREFCRGLARQGVLLAPGDCFGMASHFRLGFAASGEGFERALERVEEFVGARASASRRVPACSSGAPG